MLKRKPNLGFKVSRKEFYWILNGFGLFCVKISLNVIEMCFEIFRNFFEWATNVATPTQPSRKNGRDRSAAWLFASRSINVTLEHVLRNTRALVRSITTHNHITR